MRMKSSLSLFTAYIRCRSIEILSQAKNDMDASTSSDFDYEEAVVWGEK